MGAHPGQGRGHLRGGAGGSLLLVPTVRPGHRRLLLHEQQVPALRQHRPRVSLPALPASLQGHPALRGRPGGRADRKAGEQRARPFVWLVLPNSQRDLGRRRVETGEEGQRLGRVGKTDPHPLSALESQPRGGRAQLWLQDPLGHYQLFLNQQLPRSPVAPTGVGSAWWGHSCLQAAPEGAESQPLSLGGPPREARLGRSAQP